VAEERVLLTREGLAKLREELEYLRNVRLPEVAQSLEQARSTNLSTEDEPGYELTREEQAAVEGRIVQIEDMLARAEVIDEDAVQQSGIVQIGSTVVVVDDAGREQSFQIVNPLEVDAIHGKISSESPVGRALLGHRAGDEIEVTVPTGTRRLKIVSLT
jgi:transcription elongation factor GreA